MCPQAHPTSVSPLVGVLMEAADTGFLDGDTIRGSLGDEVATLVHDVLRVHRCALDRYSLTYAGF